MQKSTFSSFNSFSFISTVSPPTSITFCREGREKSRNGLEFVNTIEASGRISWKLQKKDHFKESGFRQYERLVEYPLWDEYGDLIKSDFADLKNVGTRWGGAIIAGQFIEEFVEKLPWLHLDIAGPAFIESKSKFGSAGGTGAGTRLLYEFIKNFWSQYGRAVYLEQLFLILTESLFYFFLWFQNFIPLSNIFLFHFWLHII